jgi:hypothetical protein
MKKTTAIALCGWALAVIGFWFLILHGSLSENSFIVVLALLMFSTPRFLIKKPPVSGALSRKEIYSNAALYLFVLVVFIFPLFAKPISDLGMAICLALLFAWIVADGVKIVRRIRQISN